MNFNHIYPWFTTNSFQTDIHISVLSLCSFFPTASNLCFQYVQWCSIIHLKAGSLCIHHQALDLVYRTRHKFCCVEWSLNRTSSWSVILKILHIIPAPMSISHQADHHWGSQCMQQGKNVDDCSLSTAFVTSLAPQTLVSKLYLGILIENLFL